MGRVFGATTTPTPSVLPKVTSAPIGKGRIFGGTTPEKKEEVSGIKGTGRIFGVPDNPSVQPLNVKTWGWEDMPLGEKIWRTAKELPNVLRGFLPPSAVEITAPGRRPSIPEVMWAGVKSAGELGLGVARLTAEAIIGGGLGAKQLVTRKPEKIEVPVLGEISSWQVQAKNLEDQGFAPDEAAALVGMNAYLGAVPVFAKVAKIKALKPLGEKIATKEIPFAETPEGIRRAISAKAELVELQEKLPVLKSEKAIAKTQARIEELQKPSPMVRIERPFITEVKRVFGKAEEQKQFGEILEQHMDRYFEGRKVLLAKEEPLNKNLLKLTDEELKDYSNVTQGLPIAKEPSANLKSAVELWKKTNQEIEVDLVARGKLTPEQVENRRWKPVETTTGRTREELKAMGIEPIYYPYLAEDLLKKSDFIATTGRRTKGGYLKRFTGKMLQEDSYIKDPRVAIPRHRLQVFRDKMNNELVDTIKQRFAEKDSAVIRAYKDNPGLAERLGVEEWKPSGTLRFYPMEKAVGVTKKVESYWMPEAVAKELNNFSKPGRLEKFLRLTYDPLIDMWRVSVLSLVPRWLYNNFVGNTMLSVLGKTDPLAFIKSAKEMFARTKLGEKLEIARREIPEKVFMKEYAGGEMTKAGQLGGLPTETTQFLRPIGNWLNLLEQAKNYKVLRIPATITQKLIEGWVALGKPIGYLNKVTENWFRGAMYISKTEGKFLGFQLDKPVPPMEGLKYVNEFLFDYSKLSRAERATFRRALPFWNWMKNITAFAFKFPAKHPLRGLIAGVLLQDYVDYINEINQAEDRVKSILRFKTDMTYENKPLYLNIKSAIPFSDVFKTIPTNFETFGRFLTSNPVSKIIIERGFRLNSFTGQPFTQPKELQKYDEYGKPIPPVPSFLRHIGQQMPQFKLAEQIKDYLRYGKPLKRYETGKPQVLRGQIRTADLLMEVLGYFGIKLSATEYNAIQRSVEKKTRLQEVKERKYERQLEGGLKRLEIQSGQSFYKGLEMKSVGEPKLIKGFPVRKIGAEIGKTLLGSAVMFSGGGALGMLAVSKIYGLPTEWTKNLTEEVKNKFPFEEEALKGLEDTTVRQFDFPEDIKGQYLARGQEVFNLAKKLGFSDKIATKIADWKLSQRFDKPTIKIEKDLQQPVQTILAHEMLHHFSFIRDRQTNGKFFEDWWYSWDEATKKYPQLIEIDRDIEQRGYDINNPYDFSRERYSFLGQKAIDEGIKVVPPELREFYGGIIKMDHQ